MRTLLLGTLVVACLATTAILDRESGIWIWRSLRGDLAASAARVATLSAGNEALRREIESWEADPSATDRAIREELDVALPGETVVRFVASPPASGRSDGRAGAAGLAWRGDGTDHRSEMRGLR